jgi:hypothetical protein
LGVMQHCSTVVLLPLLLLLRLTGWHWLQDA